MKKIFGFSLIEIIVGLIIVSVLLAALAPIITKRFKSSSLTVGAIGSSNSSGGSSSSEDGDACAGKQCSEGYYANKWEGCNCSACSASFCKKCENDQCSECIDGYELIDGECKGGTASCRESGGKPTQECCESVGAVYLPKATTGLSTDLCMMKYNAFDGPIEGLHAAQNLVRLADINTKCYTNSCCWRGSESNKSSSSCTVGMNSNSLYSGCTRTICQGEAASAICSNWSPSNYAPGAWRLPTTQELNAIKSNVSILSLNQGAAGLQLCDATSSSLGSDSCSSRIDVCNVNFSAHSENDCHPASIWGQGGLYLQLSSGKVTIGTDKLLDKPKGVRCVTSNVASGVLNIHNANTSLGEPSSQNDCDKFNALFIPAKYSGNPNGKNICMTKFNALDNGGPFYPYNSSIAKMGIKLVQRDFQYCDTGKCCWAGVTSSSYTDGGGYSGSSRTLCQITAAESLCANWSPDGSYKGAWRLPYLSELNSIANYLSSESLISYFLNQYLYEKGLQLCDYSSSSGVAKCAPLIGNSTSVCGINSGQADVNDDCAPYRIWGNDNSFLQLKNGFADTGTEANKFAYPKSVRCVSDAVYGSNQNDEPIDGLAVSDVLKYQKVCDKYNALFIPKKYLGTNKNICMTKFNALDVNGPMVDYSDEQLANLSIPVTRVKAGENCNADNCCWGQTNTSTSYTVSQNGDSTYSGQNRTVCQANAAQSICSNWAPSSATIGKWRLPNETELKNLALYMNNETKYSYFLNHFSGKSGLQLCDFSSSSYGADKCSYKIDVCRGNSASSGSKDDCYPSKIWGVTNLYLNLNNGVASVGNESAYDNPKSVRCVTEAEVN